MTRNTAERNLKLVLTTSILSGFRMYEGVLAVYLAILTDSYAIGMAYFALINISSSIFEVPTGLVSDRLGRRLTLASHFFIDALTILIVLLATDAWGVYLAGMLGGLSMALRSGTKSAFVYENLVLLGRPDQYKRVWGRIRAFNRYSFTLAGGVGAVIIYFSGVTTALALSLVPLRLAFVLSFWFQNIASATPKGNSVYEDLRIACKGFVLDSALRNISIGQIFSVGLGNPEYRYRSLFFSALFPLWVVNILGALNNFLSGVFMQAAHAVVARFGLRISLVYLDLINRFVILGAIVSRSFPGAMVMNIFTSISFGTRAIASEELLQQRYSKSQRATMGSLVGLGGNILYGIFAIFLGFMADTIGLYYAMLIAQPFLLLAPWFFNRGVNEIARINPRTDIH